MEKEEFDLKCQLKELAKKYFPLAASNLPGLVVKRPTTDQRDNSPCSRLEGPACLEIDLSLPADKRTGTICIDESVYTFQEKTTPILILHELVHYNLFLETGDPDSEEGQRFQKEVRRLWDAGAYKKLL